MIPTKPRSHAAASRIFIAGLALIAAAAHAQTLSGDALVKALRQGGYVIAMRHASSPEALPAPAAADRENVKRERQLDQNGRDSAAAMGRALRRLKIPIGDVFTSPTYRAIETARLAGLPDPKLEPELGDNGHSMRSVTEGQAAWLRKKVAEFPTGTNTVLVTHSPNLTAAFPDLASNLTDGEAMIFGSDGKGGAKLVARVRIGEWPELK